MAIAAAGVRAEGGGDDATENGTPVTQTQTCGENEAKDDRFARMSERGTEGDDDMEGDRGDDDLQGEEGDDDLCGHDGDDELKGGPGNDHLVGGRGDDDEQGQQGDDDLEGDQGNDDLNGGKGHDDVSGGAGNDLIRVRDGQRDVVHCGRGRDRVRADRRDRIAKDCESVKRS